MLAQEDGKIEVGRLQEEEGGQGDRVSRWEVRGPLSCMALHPEGVLAAGGKERELGLWDVASGQCSWEAKNVPHDKLDLRLPVWVTACRFLQVRARPWSPQPASLSWCRRCLLLLWWWARRVRRCWPLARPTSRCASTTSGRSGGRCGAWTWARRPTASPP